MSYRISYLVPKKEFKCLLLGKKQSRAVQEASAKKSSTPSRKAKPKKGSSAPRRHAKSKTTKKRERSKKVKSPDREKTRGKQSGVRKKRRVQDEERDPWAWGKNQTTTESQRWGESEPSLKKSKKENVEKYFDDVPKKRRKLAD